MTTHRRQRALLGASGLIAAATLTATAGAAGISSASRIGSEHARAARAKSTVTIPAIISETGSASFLGADEAKALVALEKAVNARGGIDGHPLKFNILDDQSTPTVAVSLAAPLIHKTNVLLVGSITTTDRPVDALVTKAGPVIYDLSPGDHPRRGGFVYSAADSTVAQAHALANFAKLKGWTRVAAITSTDASGQDGWTSIQIATKADRLKVLDHETFAPTDTSVTSQLATIKATNPQALFIWTTGTPIGTVFKGMQQLGMENLPTFTTPGNESYAELTGFGSILPKQLYFPSPAFQSGPSHFSGALKTAIDQFDTAMKNAGVSVPDEGASLSYDPANVIINALKAVGPFAPAKKIRAYINHLNHYAGADGYYNFTSKKVAPDQRGLGIHDVYVTMWDNAIKNWVGVTGSAGGNLLKK